MINHPAPTPHAPAAAPRAWYDAVPAHVRYPGMILFFLIGSVAAQMILLRSALSDGGAQVVPDYYAQSVAWEEVDAARHLAAQIGLQLTLSEEPSGPLRLVLRDRASRPLEGITGSVTLTRPQLSEVVDERALDALERDASGAYLIALPQGASHGLWDITLRFTDAKGRRFEQSYRRER